MKSIRILGLGMVLFALSGCEESLVEHAQTTVYHLKSDQRGSNRIKLVHGLDRLKSQEKNLGSLEEVQLRFRFPGISSARCLRVKFWRDGKSENTSVLAAGSASCGRKEQVIDLSRSSIHSISDMLQYRYEISDAAIDTPCVAYEAGNLVGSRSEFCPVGPLLWTQALSTKDQLDTVPIEVTWILKYQKSSR